MEEKVSDFLRETIEVAAQTIFSCILLAKAWSNVHTQLHWSLGNIIFILCSHSPAKVKKFQLWQEVKILE